MKLFATIALIAASTATFAFGKTKVETSYNTIVFGPGVLNYSMVCLNDAGQLQTKKALEVCTKYERRGSGDNRDRVCVETENRIFTTDLEYTKKVCVKEIRGGDRRGECAKYETVTAFHPTSFTKTVTEYKWQGSRRDGGWNFPGKVLSKEVLEVPACN
jgi:hypothetical protein